MKKQEGVIEVFVGMFIISITLIMISANSNLKSIKSINNFVSNGLISSNLASDIIDLDEFGKSRTIKISDPNKSFSLFEKTLRENLKLDDKNENKLIDNNINIDNFTIYNVKGNDIEVIQMKPIYSKYIVSGGVNKTYSPDGVLISSTSVYSKVSYKVKNMIGTIDRSNQCTTDISSI